MTRIFIQLVIQLPDRGVRTSGLRNQLTARSCREQAVDYNRDLDSMDRRKCVIFQPTPDAPSFAKDSSSHALVRVEVKASRHQFF